MASSGKSKDNAQKDQLSLHGSYTVVKLVIIGDSDIGKSSMLLRFVDKLFPESFITTIGVDFKIKYMNIGDKKVKVELWDTAGQERWLGVTTRMYRNANGFILAYDITNRTSFQHVRTWMDEIYQHGSEQVPIYLVGNKKDLEEKRQVTSADGQKLANNYLVPFCEASAKSGENIEEMFEEFIHKIVGDSEGDTRLSRRSNSIIQPAEDDKPRKNADSQSQCQC